MTPRPTLAAATIAALFVTGAVFVGNVSRTSSIEIADAPPSAVSEATSDPGVVNAPVVPTSAVVVDVVPGPVASGTFAPAERVERVQVGVPPTVPTGLNGLPFAPDDLTGCDEMEWYADQAGLPDDFGWIGEAESNCRNDVSSWCCYGYWQIHTVHIGAGSLDECDVDEAADYFGTDPIARQRNACMARRVLRRQGVCAWDVVSC